MVDCATDLVCESDICKVPLGGACLDGQCVSQATCDNGLCRPTLDGSCAAVGCASGFVCNGIICKVGPGGACSEGDCASDLICDAGTCKGILGGPCSGSAPCVGALVCQSGTCELCACCETSGALRFDGSQCTGGTQAPHVCRSGVCVASLCGDGFVDPANGEDCDDGNSDPGDDCTPKCRGVPKCGVERLEPVPMSFDSSSELVLEGVPAGLVLEDFDDDTDLDIAVAASTAHKVAVFKNDGLGGFTLFKSLVATPRPFSVRAGDFDEDGKLDLVCSSETSGNIGIFRGKGGGEFFEMTNVPVGGETVGVAVADFDRDQNIDIAVIKKQLNQWRRLLVLRGNGSGGFPSSDETDLGDYEHGRLSLGDLNKDGWLDLFVGVNLENSFPILLGGASGALFSPAQRIGTSAPPLGVASGDLDCDGRADIVAALYRGGKVQVIWGPGDSSSEYDNPGALQGGEGAGEALIADFDRNGAPDIALVNLNGTLQILLGRGDRTFDALPYIPYNGRSGSAAYGDLNGDGRLDLILPKGNGDNVQVLINRSTE